MGTLSRATISGPICCYMWPGACVMLSSVCGALRADLTLVASVVYRSAMADSNDLDLDQFSRWYSQAGD